MPADPMVAVEIQALRLELQLFAGRYSDDVRSQCAIIDERLARLLDGDDPIILSILAHAVETLGRLVNKGGNK